MNTKQIKDIQHDLNNFLVIFESNFFLLKKNQMLLASETATAERKLKSTASIEEIDQRLIESFSKFRNFIAQLKDETPQA